MQQENEMNRMGTESIKGLMLSMGLPMIVSMVLQAMYNIVDSAFVSRIPVNGEAALNALTLAFPVQMLMVAIGVGTGVGINALLSKSLGQNDRERVNQVAGNGIFLAAVIFAVFLLFGIFGVPAFIRSQTSNGQIVEMAIDYLRICCVLSFGIVFYSIYEKLLQATGRTMYSTIAQVSGALTNIIMDPIMIYGWLGCPEMGVRGAAYATVLGQIVSLALALFFHARVNREVENGLQYLKPNLRIIGRIYAIGLPAIISQALMSVMTYGMNVILGGIEEAAVTAYGLYYKIQQFVLFAAFGLRDAITPVVSFNYGMGSRERVQEGIKYGMIYTLVIMLAGMLVLEVFANPLSAIFGLSGNTQALCVSAMHVITLSFVFAGANIAFQGVFQAIDGGLESLIISICRQFLFVLPLAWMLARRVSAGGNIWLVWTAFPVAEIASLLIACALMKRLYHRRIAPLPSGKTTGRQGRPARAHG